MKFDHLSSSQINKWIDDPSLWILDKIYGVESGRMPAAWRGNAVEKALAAMFTGEFDRDSLIGISYSDFAERGGLRTDREWNAIPGYIAQLIPFIKDCGWGAPDGCQTRLETEIEGVRVIGYMDYEWGGVVRDCKTTGRMPSFSRETGLLRGKDDHLRQMSIYTHNSNRNAELFYVTPKAVRTYQPSQDELSTAFRHVRAAVRAMKEYEVQDWWRYVPRDMTFYKWADHLREKAKELWKL